MNVTEWFILYVPVAHARNVSTFSCRTAQLWIVLNASSIFVATQNISESIFRIPSEILRDIKPTSLITLQDFTEAAQVLLEVRKNSPVGKMTDVVFLKGQGLFSLPPRPARLCASPVFNSVVGVWRARPPGTPTVLFEPECIFTSSVSLAAQQYL
jgi:hypothetical protein